MELMRHRVPEDSPLTTVGRYLEGTLGLSGTLVKRLKMAGGIQLNGAVVRSNHALGPGDELVLTLAANAAVNVDAEPIPLAVVYEDQDLIVLDKPTRMVVHPTKGVYTGTLANGLAYRFASRGEPSGIHPVHRLDRETSGLVLFARHALAHQRLDAQMRARGIARTYEAFVQGHLAEPSGRIEAPIGLRGDHPVARAVRADGQWAATCYERVATYERPLNSGSSLVRLTLETGRTHQIRVHMAHLGHPLLGDDLYAPEPDPPIDRQALHAAVLTFEHPRTGEPLRFEAPWPDDLTALAQFLNAGT